MNSIANLPHTHCWSTLLPNVVVFTIMSRTGFGLYYFLGGSCVSVGPGLKLFSYNPSFPISLSLSLFLSLSICNCNGYYSHLWRAPAVFILFLYFHKEFGMRRPRYDRGEHSTFICFKIRFLCTTFSNVKHD